MSEMRLIADCARGVCAPHHAAETLLAEGWSVTHELLHDLVPSECTDAYAEAVDELADLRGPDDLVVLCTENNDWFVCTKAQRDAYEYAQHY